jgi:hypothetical protein
MERVGVPPSPQDVWHLSLGPGCHAGLGHDTSIQCSLKPFLLPSFDIGVYHTKDIQDQVRTPEELS